jgi:hypothetical protein
MSPTVLESDPIPVATAVAPLPAKDPANDRIRYHATYLFLAVAVLGLAMFLRIGPRDQVVIPGLDYDLPETCAYRQLVGIGCPGCGMTRGFISLMRGRWQQAWTYNPGVYLLFFLVVIQIPYRAIQIRRARLAYPEWRHPKLTATIVCGLVLGLIGQWLVRLLVS